MQTQTTNSGECSAAEAVLIESLLAQAQDNLFQSNRISQATDKIVMLNTAKKFAEDVLALDDSNTDAHHVLALSHTLLGESSRAKKHIAKAFALGGPNQALQLEKAHIDLAAGHYNKAESGFMEVLKQEPSSVDAFLGLAIVKQKKKDWGSAFLHYNSLINKQIITETVLTGLSAVIPHIDAEFWSAEYETTVLTALSWQPSEKAYPTTIDKGGYARISNSLLIHKYSLENEDSQLDFGALIQDQLLFEVLCHKLIASAEVEGLLTLIRETLLTQITDTRDLPDILQKWVIALAQAAVFYGFSWPVNDREALILSELALAIKAAAKGPESVSNCAGAVMLYSMYEELYSSPFSYLLLKNELDQWPAGLQAILASSLYEPAQLHATEVGLKQMVSPSASSLIYERTALPVFPKWTSLPDFKEQSATQFLLDTFGGTVPLKARKRPLNLLVSACGTGKHALLQAAQYNDVNLTGADINIANLAFADYQARNLDIDNIRWVQCAEDKLTCLNQCFDIVDWSTPLNFSQNPQETLFYIKKLMARTSIAKIRIELNQDRSTENLLKKLARNNHLEPNLHTLRSVRRAIIDDTNKADWQTLLSNPAFYHTGSCMKIVFGQESVAITSQQMEAHLDASNLQLIGISDSNTGKVYQTSSLVNWESSFPLSAKPTVSLILFVKRNL